MLENLLQDAKNFDGVIEFERFEEVVSLEAKKALDKYLHTNDYTK